MIIGRQALARCTIRWSDGQHWATSLAHERMRVCMLRQCALRSSSGQVLRVAQIAALLPLLFLRSKQRVKQW